MQQIDSLINGFGMRFPDIIIFIQLFSLAALQLT